MEYARRLYQEREEGKAEGREEISILYQYLSEHQLNEELNNCFTDSTYRDQLLEELRPQLQL